MHDGRTFGGDSLVALPLMPDEWEDWLFGGTVVAFMARQPERVDTVRAALAVMKFRVAEGRFPASMAEVGGAWPVFLQLLNLDDGRLVLRDGAQYSGGNSAGELDLGDIVLRR